MQYDDLTDPEIRLLRALLAAGGEKAYFSVIQTWLGPKVRLSPVGLEVVGELDLPEWREIGMKLGKLHVITTRLGAYIGSLRFCARCREPLPSTSTSRRRFCSDRCRIAARRRRQAGVPEFLPGQRGRRLGGEAR